jgi:hypothetical protein
MPEPIRVRDDKTGAEYSTYGVDENGDPYEGLTKLDEDAVDVHGEMLPPKYPAAETPAAPKPAAPTTGPKTTPKES